MVVIAFCTPGWIVHCNACLSFGSLAGHQDLLGSCHLARLPFSLQKAAENKGHRIIVITLENLTVRIAHIVCMISPVTRVDSHPLHRHVTQVSGSKCGRILDLWLVKVIGANDRIRDLGLISRFVLDKDFSHLVQIQYAVNWDYLSSIAAFCIRCQTWLHMTWFIGFESLSYWYCFIPVIFSPWQAVSTWSRYNTVCFQWVFLLLQVCWENSVICDMQQQQSICFFWQYNEYSQKERKPPNIS